MLTFRTAVREQCALQYASVGAVGQGGVSPQSHDLPLVLPVSDLHGPSPEPAIPIAIMEPLSYQLQRSESIYSS